MGSQRVRQDWATSLSLLLFWTPKAVSSPQGYIPCGLQRVWYNWVTEQQGLYSPKTMLRENLYQSTARSNPRSETNESGLSFLPISETTTADKQMKQISFRYSEPISDAWYNIEIATAKSFWGHFPGVDVLLAEGNGTLLQYSCLENPMSGGAW